MNRLFFQRLAEIIFLLCANFISGTAESSWNRKPPDIAGSLYRPDEPPSHVTKGRTPGLRRIYGPHLEHKNCPKYEILAPSNIQATRKELDECTDIQFPCHGAKYSKFRTQDGSCNNLKHPAWGMSNTCLKRILPFDFADEISTPRISCTGKPLPNPRHVSNVFHRTVKELFSEFTTHFMEWGQMVCHDMVLNDVMKTPESGYNTAIDCCKNGPVYNDRCMSVSIPASDTFYPHFNVTCINIARTVPCRLCQGGQRVQSNQNTAYLDICLVYGCTDEVAHDLRSKSRGMLKMESREYGPMLRRVAINEGCVSPTGQRKCYLSGDMRINRNPFLSTAHIFLARHHNFICSKLYKINPHWDDERLYQEARRINIAVVQWITYGTYLPHLLGKEVVRKEGLEVLPGKQFTKYDPHLDASTVTEYSAFAGKYYHTQIPGLLSEVEPKRDRKHNTCHRVKDTIFLRDYFNRPFEIPYGQFDQVAIGMSIDKAMKRDAALSDDIRNYLSRRVYLNETFGSDEASTSIVRGQDHGIPGYTYYLKYFYDKKIDSFDDLRGILPDKSVDSLEELYESVHDIDPYSGGFAEYPVPGAVLGPVLGAVLAYQYKRTKFGDRYYFEHGNEAGSFTPEQLLEIKRSTLSRILCDTVRFDCIQKDVFLPPSDKNPLFPCKSIHKFNFRLWKE